MGRFENFVRKLQERLGKNLPGLKAQLQMAPITRLMEAEQEQTATEARKSAVLVLFYPDNGNTKFILIKRAFDQSVHSGQVSFPGGKAEETDRNLEATALREASEEIGLPPETVTLIGSLSKLYIPPSNFEVFPFVGFVMQKPLLKPNREVRYILEVDFEELRKPATCTEKIIIHRTGKEVTVPSYAVQNETIWGATAMMLAELVAIAEGI
ncbi:MAG: CoA pyrophosphatase [Bacteroidales bacterium]|nr:CoA pyrophosphatase [Bacteroidales bacterium]